MLMYIFHLFQGVALEYDPAKTYSYLYETDVLLNDMNSKKATRPQQDVGVKMEVNFKLSTLYKDSEVQLFKLLVSTFAYYCYHEFGHI